MDTPIYLTGFENGFMIEGNGGGLAGFVQDVTIDSTEHHTGSYSLKSGPSTQSAYYRWTLPGTPGEVCGRFYFKITSDSVDDQVILDITTTNGGTSTRPLVGTDVSKAKLPLKSGT